MPGRTTRFDTLALRRELWSNATTAAPAAAAGSIAYGDDDDPVEEVRVFLGEALADAPPRRILRHLLPAGTTLLEAHVPLARTDLPVKLRRRVEVAITAIVVPDVTDAGATPRGHWVFVPVLAHTFYAARGDDLAARLRDEASRVVDAASLSPAAWKRLLPPAATELVPVEVAIAGEGADAAGSRRAALEAERKRRAAKLLDEVGARLDDHAAGGLPLLARERELASLDALLAGRERLSVLLVGDEGVGKSALWRAWAAGAARHGRPAWATSTAQLVAGASGLGEWQERVAGVLDAIELLDGVLYLDDFGALFADRPEEGGFHVASLLRRWVTGNRARVVGELTPAQLDAAERREVALIAAMTRLRLEPLDAAATLGVCRGLAAAWARAQPARPQLADDALPVVVELARRYLPYRAFPGKAIRFLDELRAVHDGERDVAGEPRRLGAEEVYDGFALVTGIPAFLLRDDRALRVDQVIARFRARLIGQEEAVRRVAETICVVKAQLQPADRPLATFLFVGPTGVGKTELAKSLAHLLFGAEDRLIRFDMSEYTDPWAAERLIRGSASGEGLLTARVREQPFCVLLLDEIEKAHASVFDLLLQVTGEGRLTDARGRTTYFHNAIIIMTSNLGTRGPRAALGIATGDAATRDRDAELERYRAAVAGAFRPELVGRIDRVIAFHRLGADEVARVARLALARLAERRGLVQAGIALDVSAAALDRLAVGGHSEEYGVRALRRHLEQHVIAPAARLIAEAGPEAQGGLLLVRTPDEAAAPVDAAGAALAVGARLGGASSGGASSSGGAASWGGASSGGASSSGGAASGAAAHGVALALYRRSAAGGKRALRGAMAVAELRRACDRELAHPLAISARDQAAWLRGQLATAIAPPKRPQKARARARGPKAALAAAQIQAMQIELARLTGAWDAAAAQAAELRAAEELVLDALAAGDDADEVVDAAAASRDRFRAALFWLLVARQEVRDQVTLIAHGPDAAAGLGAWTRAILDACARRGWAVDAHLRPSEGGGPPYREGAGWGPPRAAAALAARLDEHPDAIRSVLLRVRGAGAALLLGLEAGLHRFAGLAKVDPCHVTVEAVAPRVDFSDDEWASPALAANRPTAAPRGAALREHPARADRVYVLGKTREVMVPLRDYGARLEEIAVEQILGRFAATPELEPAELWAFAAAAALPGARAGADDGDADDRDGPDGGAA